MNFRPFVALAFSAIMAFGPVAVAYSPIDLYRCSPDAQIVEALRRIEQTSAASSVKFIVEHNVKVLFRDMRDFGAAYRNHDAISWIADDGRQLVYINAKHITAPPEALAAIISHEVMHADRDNSLAEEITAWQREGLTWKELVVLHPELTRIRTGAFPLVDRLNAIVVLDTQNKLQSEIRQNVAYQGLPSRSPGF